MQLEEFENKIKDLWMKPIDELENPEFIKYCDKFFEDETLIYLTFFIHLKNLFQENGNKYI